MKLLNVSLLSVMLFTGIYAQNFTRFTYGQIVTEMISSWGSSWGDFDNDGDLDVFIVNDGSNFLYQNNGDAIFKKIILYNTDWIKSRCSSWGDYNNDGYLDLLVVSSEDTNNFLYRNNGDGNFTRILEGSVVNDGGWSASCSWGDYNNDGFLDIFIGNTAKYEPNDFLYLNNGDETFTKIKSIPIVNDNLFSRCADWIDFDNDKDLDLYVVTNGFNLLYRNDLEGLFHKITKNEIVSDFAESNSASWGDYDNDGDLDLFVANAFGQNNNFYQNNGDGSFTKITQGSLVTDGGNSTGSTWGDFNNDGFLDLFVTNNDGENNYFYLNDRDGSFTKITQGDFVNDAGCSMGCSSVDFDLDGDLDLFITNRNFEKNFFYLNNSNMKNWIEIQCTGQISNTTAIGAKVKVKANINGKDIWQMREISGNTGHDSQNSLYAHFGLDDAIIVKIIRIEWPSGITQELSNIKVNQFIKIVEPSKILLEMPIIKAFPGDTIYVPLHVRFPLDTSFSSCEMTLEGYSHRLEFIEIVTYSTIAGEAGWMMEYNENESSLIIAMAGVNNISGKGVLFKLKFVVFERASGFIPIEISKVLFDKGTIPVNIKSGGVQIFPSLLGDVDLNRYVQAYDASLILKYLASSVNLDTFQQKNANVSLDTTISTLDASLILQYLVGIVDTLPYDTSKISFIASGKVWLEDRKIYPGQILTIPLNLSEAENIYSFHTRFILDTEVLKFKAFYLSEMFEKNIFEIYELGNKLEIFSAGTSVVYGDGYVGTLQFSVNEQYIPDTTKLILNFLQWNEERGFFNVDTLILSKEITSIDDDILKIPAKTELFQNYPNPFNPETSISYQISHKSKVKLHIFNILGSEVKLLVDEFQDPGHYEVTWNGKNMNDLEVPSGVYILKLNVGNLSQTKKMVLFR
jgi:hypothetical protein